MPENSFNVVHFDDVQRFGDLTDETCGQGSAQSLERVERGRAYGAQNRDHNRKFAGQLRLRRTRTARCPSRRPFAGLEIPNAIDAEAVHS
ncbi:MAG: hypothetical protein C3F11_10615 [Methylocystaceae bacterium]|nr:MAG: hypothetical protein C3F11_10615 [Methylocystaceae bacterium]